MYPKLTSSPLRMQKRPLPTLAGSRSVVEALFGDEEYIKEPGRVREVGTHVWVQSADAAKEVDKDEALDRRQWRRWSCSGD